MRRPERTTEKFMARSPAAHRVLLGVMLALAALPAAAAGACTIADLAFLLGDWRSDDGATTGEEHWVLTAANTLAGSSWEARGNSLSFMETLSVLPQNERIELHLRHFDGALNHAWEERDAPMVFALAQCDGQGAVFDGTGARAGERIAYRRSAQGLTFIGDFLHQGKPVHVEVNMRKAGG